MGNIKYKVIEPNGGLSVAYILNNSLPNVCFPQNLLVNRLNSKVLIIVSSSETAVFQYIFYLHITNHVACVLLDPSQDEGDHDKPGFIL